MPRTPNSRQRHFRTRNAALMTEKAQRSGPIADFRPNDPQTVVPTQSESVHLFPKVCCSRVTGRDTPHSQKCQP
jgi:hypothetical protein